MVARMGQDSRREWSLQEGDSRASRRSAGEMRKIREARAPLGDRSEDAPLQRYPTVRASVKTKSAEFVSPKIRIKDPQSLSRFL